MTRDPLISAARFAIYATRGLLWFLVGLMTLVTIFAIVASDAQLAETSAEILTDSGTRLERDQMILFALLIGVVAFLAERFFQQLGAIVDTVHTGEPFRVENAHRLQRMALLGLLFMTFELEPVGVSDSGVELADGGTLQIGVTFDGIFIAIILFVLARVFRQGVRMREDLEGTV